VVADGVEGTELIGNLLEDFAQVRVKGVVVGAACFQTQMMKCGHTLASVRGLQLLAVCVADGVDEGVGVAGGVDGVEEVVGT
jgi:hypothetical protein